MDSSSKPIRKSKSREQILTDALFNRLRLVIAFEDYPSQIDHILPTTYSPRVLGSCTLAWHLPSDPLSIDDYRRCLVIPGEVPYFIAPPLHSYFPREQPHSFIKQMKLTSILPLLITAQHARIDIRQYDIISERNSFRRIAMNNENYTIGVVKFGSTVFLRRYDTYTSINRNDIGYRFEQMCTTGTYLDGNYFQLIEGHIGSLRTLITGEIDTIDQQNGQSIELKCCKKNGDREQQDWWLQAFLSKYDISA
jgi:hypothetical protein